MINFLFLVLIVLFFSFTSIMSDAIDKPKNMEIVKPEISWESWKKNLYKKLVNSKKYKLDTLTHIKDLKFNKKVILLDRKQPEFKLTFQEYLDKITPEEVTKLGKNKYLKNKLLINNISKEYSVPSELLVSLWGIESKFGAHKGGFDILNSLASLAYDGRRSDFFLKQFIMTLEILDKNFLEKKQLIGSWAGAMGQTQFMPGTFLAYAVDYNKDGKKNLIKHKEDALASGANYLSKSGWNVSLPWGEEVADLKINKEIMELSSNKAYKSQVFWKDLGFFLKKRYDSKTKFRLIIPDLTSKKYFLVTSNYDVILKWNRSNYFALAVGLLSDNIGKLK